MQETIKLRGTYKFTKAIINSPEQFELVKLIEDLRKKGGNFMPFVRMLNRFAKTQVTTVSNIIPTVGRTMIADNFTNTSPDDAMLINYIAIGTGSTAPANGDTTLVTESYRNVTASRTNASNVLYVSGFFSATETNGTFKEAAMYCNGTASADTGILLSRVLLNSGTGIAKSVTETLTIDWTLTIT